MNEEPYPIINVLLFLIVLTIGCGFIYYVYRSNVTYERLFEECMDDGLKEYECYSALKNTSPLIITK